jgi:hypothetical protein
MIIDELIRKIEKVTCKKVYNTFYPLSESKDILDEIMYKHKLKRSFTITTISILLAIIVAFIIKNAFFN